MRDSEYWGGNFEKIRCDGLTEVQTPYAFPPDPASALQLSITDVAYLRMLNEASDTTFWLEGIELLLKHFKVERMDIVYDDPIEAWQYIDDGTAMLVVSNIPKYAVRVFITPELEEVREFFLDVF